MGLLKRLLFASMMLCLCGCPSTPLKGPYLRSGIGQPIEGVRQRIAREGSYASSIGWKETTYPLDNGNWVYVDPAGEIGKLVGGGECFIHWEVNPQGIIVGAHTEGKGCRWWW